MDSKMEQYAAGLVRTRREAEVEAEAASSLFAKARGREQQLTDAMDALALHFQKDAAEACGCPLDDVTARHHGWGWVISAPGLLPHYIPAWAWLKEAAWRELPHEVREIPDGWPMGAVHRDGSITVPLEYGGGTFTNLEAATSWRVRRDDDPGRMVAGLIRWNILQAAAKGSSGIMTPEELRAAVEAEYLPDAPDPESAPGWSCRD